MTDSLSKNNGSLAEDPLALVHSRFSSLTGTVGST